MLLQLYRGADKSLARPRKEKKLMFLSEWREFPSAPCLAGGKTTWQVASGYCWNRARPWRASELVSFLVGVRTYQHPGNWNRTTTIDFLRFQILHSLSFYRAFFFYLTNRHRPDALLNYYHWNRLSWSLHRLLNLPDTQGTTQRRRSVGPAFIGRAVKKITLYHEGKVHPMISHSGTEGE